MIPDLPKRAGLVALIFLAACSGSSSSVDTTSTTSAVETTPVVETSTSSTTTTIYYLYPADFVEDFTRGCTEVNGERSACLCVIDRAQSVMAFEDFAELVEAETLDFEAGTEILAIVDACRV